jgi:hypothetical protein
LAVAACVVWLTTGVVLLTLVIADIYFILSKKSIEVSFIHFRLGVGINVKNIAGEEFVRIIQV